MPIEHAPILEQTAIGFGVTLGALVVLAKAAPKLGLLDYPSARKQHLAPTPLVGGIAIYLALCTALILYTLGVPVGLPISLVSYNSDATVMVFITGCTILVVTGALDDRFQLGVFVRLLAEFAVALLLIETLHLHFTDIGNLLGSGPITVPYSLGYGLGLLVIVGIINAYNMLDGIDGLLPALALCAMLVFRFLSNHPPGLFGMTFAGALLAFLAANLQLIPRLPKVFLGDAGSKLLGFAMVALLLTTTTSQVGTPTLSKVTALYVIGLPLYDLGYVVLRRLSRGQSPFKPDLNHLHHLLKASGASDRRTVALIVVIQLFIGYLGWLVHNTNMPEYHQFGMFMGGFVLYVILVHQVQLAVAYFHHQNRSDNANPKAAE